MFASLCLLLAGDVEANPGPDKKVLLKELCDGKKAILSVLGKINDRLQKLEEVMDLCRNQANSIPKLIKTAI